eukprot:3903714-Heterocapsa_arctica.AAC.1
MNKTEQHRSTKEHKGAQQKHKPQPSTTKETQQTIKNTQQDNRGMKPNGKQTTTHKTNNRETTEMQEALETHWKKAMR